MKLHKLRLNNFGPYYGSHELSLASLGDARITLIHGENMRGKTTLINAIKWCLYGILIESEKGSTQLYELLNYDAIDEGEFVYSVELTFSHQGYQYELERHVQAPSKPEDDSHLDVSVYLKRDGHFLPSEQIDDAINDILHRDVSRFFLFDGEMLQQYEALVRTEDVRTDLVKRSIERILGLPALRLAIEDLEAQRKTSAKRQRKAVKKRKETRELLADCDRLEDKVSGLESDLEDLRDQESDLEGRRQKLRDKRKQHAAVREEAKRLEAIDERIEDHQEERDNLVDECGSLLADAWWQPVVPVSRSLRKDLQNKAQQETESKVRRQMLKHRIASLEGVIEEGSCTLCGQDIGPNAGQHIKELKKQVQKELAEVKNIGSTKDTSVAARIARLRQYDSRRELFRFEEKERQIRRLNIDIRNEKRRATDLRDALREYDIPRIREVEAELDDVIGELRLIQEEIGDIDDELSEERAKLTAKRNEVDRLPDADKAIAAEATIYNVLSETFSRAVDRFRDSLRDQVEDEASTIFKQLTTEQDYDRLRINDTYGLEIIDQENRVIRQRSKGAEQIVALSLISALNRCAVREGPIVMDTPFGRLDEEHRQNILRFLPELAAQVMLLVQSGEWGGEEDREVLGPYVGREYRIERDGKPTKSRISPIS